MGSLGHRALLQYIESNDLPGLKTFLDTRHIQVDDRDEVSLRFFLSFTKCNNPLPLKEWSNSTYGGSRKRVDTICS